jgi:predicted transposase YdaD
MIKRIRTYHDTFFQNMMEKLEVASSFFQAYVPKELLEAIDWSTLAIADSVRRDQEGKPTYTDITYHAFTKAPRSHVYFHAEQERSIDKFMLERILQYNVRLMRKHKNQGHNKLPLIINVLLYNGLKADYPHFENIYDYFERPDLAKLVMGMSFILANLNKQSEEVLLGHGAASIMEVLLKRASRINFSKWVKEHRELMRNLPAKPYINFGLDYALGVGEDKAEELIEAFATIYPELKGSIMTAAQQLRKEGIQEGIKKGLQQGIQKGMQQGMQQEKKEIAKSMLKKGLDINLIQDVTGLSKETIKELKAE